MTLLGQFPDLAAGELVYSALARFGASMPSGARIANLAMGRASGSPAADLPTGLASLARALPPRSGIDAWRLLGEGTVYPYLARFASAKGATALADWALHGTGKRASQGTLGGRLARQGTLRACADCVRQAERSGGEARWLAKHQLPGVSVCDEHWTPLAATDVPVSASRGRGRCVPLSAGLLGAALPVRPPDGGLAARIAARSREILEAPPSPGAAASAAAALRLQLRDYAWPRAPSLLASSALCRDLSAHPGFVGVLAAAGAVLDDRGAVFTAVNRALATRSPSMHPVLAIALLEFTGSDAEAILRPLLAPAPARAKALTRPPRERPGACANPLCRLHEDGPAVAPPPRTVLACSACGFAHRADATSASGIAMVRTGPLWDAELLRLLADPAQSLNSIARRLGASGHAVAGRANALGAGRPGWKASRGATAGPSSPVGLLVRHRGAWSAFRRGGGQGPAKSFPSHVRNAYRFLLRHDRAWLAVNHPLAASGRGRAEREGGPTEPGKRPTPQMAAGSRDLGSGAWPLYPDEGRPIRGARRSMAGFFAPPGDLLAAGSPTLAA